jgi:hypothetical protein
MPLLLSSTLHDQMFSFDDVLKSPQRIKFVPLTTVNTNPAICREMQASLQDDGGARTLQWASDRLSAKMAYQVHSKDWISTAYVTYLLWQTYNILNRNLYVTVMCLSWFTICVSVFGLQQHFVVSSVDEIFQTLELEKNILLQLSRMLFCEHVWCC